LKDEIIEIVSILESSEKEAEFFLLTANGSNGDIMIIDKWIQKCLKGVET